MRSTVSTHPDAHYQRFEKVEKANWTAAKAQSKVQAPEDASKIKKQCSCDIVQRSPGSSPLYIERICFLVTRRLIHVRGWLIAGIYGSGDDVKTELPQALNFVKDESEGV